VLGQFASADTELQDSGLDILGLSCYAYVEGNPEDRTDPTGNYADDGGGGGWFDKTVGPAIYDQQVYTHRRRFGTHPAPGARYQPTTGTGHPRPSALHPPPHWQPKSGTQAPKQSPIVGCGLTSAGGRCGIVYSRGSGGKVAGYEVLWQDYLPSSASAVAHARPNPRSARIWRNETPTAWKSCQPLTKEQSNHFSNGLRNTVRSSMYIVLTPMRTTISVSSEMRPQRRFARASLTVGSGTWRMRSQPFSARSRESWTVNYGSSNHFSC
jgi:hypothetical protein